MVSVPNISASVLPVTTIARGNQGRFLGRLSAAGKSAEFHSRTAFREFRARTFQQLRQAPDQFGRNWPALAAEAAGGNKAQPNANIAAPPQSGGQVGQRKPGKSWLRPAVAEDQTVNVQENGKSISITESKESGITVTITELDGGKRKTTRVQAADLPELAKKNPRAHQFYGKYFHPRPKNGKPK